MSAVECRDRDRLERFVRERIGRNGWPILSRPLERHILEAGLDLEARKRFRLGRRFEALLDDFLRSSRRAERMLHIDNAYHRTLHNLEVLLRLLVLEWPPRTRMPPWVRNAPFVRHTDGAPLLSAVRRLSRAVRKAGLAEWVLARDALAALGHDYGHTGGSDRLDGDGRSARQSHEDVAERHAARLGLDHGYPPALIVESLCAIRATTFFLRAGRERVILESDLEKKLALADITGCLLGFPDWITHVAVPVLLEKIPAWKRRNEEIARETAAVRAKLEAEPEGSGKRARLEADMAALALEDARAIKDLAEWLRAERGFLCFIDTQRLALVPGAREMWGERVASKLLLIDSLLADPSLLVPLRGDGFPLLERFAARVANRARIDEAMAEEWPREVHRLLEAFRAGSVAAVTGAP